jgi:hypothetical protein
VRMWVILRLTSDTIWKSLRPGLHGVERLTHITSTSGAPSDCSSRSSLSTADPASARELG